LRSVSQHTKKRLRTRMYINLPAKTHPNLQNHIRPSKEFWRKRSDEKDQISLEEKYAA
jgi:hypothetical protein